MHRATAPSPTQDGCYCHLPKSSPPKYWFSEQSVAPAVAQRATEANGSVGSPVAMVQSLGHVDVWFLGSAWLCSLEYPGPW